MRPWTRAAFLVIMGSSCSSKLRRDSANIDVAQAEGSSSLQDQKRSLRGGESESEIREAFFRGLGNNDPTIIKWTNAEKTCEYHKPPFQKNDADFYKDNATPFGAILRGESPARVFAETASLLAFEDRSPQAELHALIIPKKEIRSVFDLRSTDLAMLYELKEMADELYLRYESTTGGNGSGSGGDGANAQGAQGRRIVFHVPPFNSVQHLHLHVLSDRGLTMTGRLKYWSETRWCASWESVVQRLEQDLTAVPYEYNRPKGS